MMGGSSLQRWCHPSGATQDPSGTSSVTSTDFFPNNSKLCIQAHTLCDHLAPLGWLMWNKFVSPLENWTFTIEKSPFAIPI